MKKIGVVVARFQVPCLHDGHIHLLKEAAKDSDIVIVFLGYKINQPDSKNPFSVDVRKAMVMQAQDNLPQQVQLIVEGLEDHPTSNEAWSEALDMRIQKYAESFSVEDVEITLYGSRDSFIPYYHGRYSTHTISDIKAVSGTEARKIVAGLHEEDLTIEHREGIIYGLKHIYPVGMSVVDCIVYKEEDGVIYFLLGRKKREIAFRIIGGFFDVEQDASLEDAATREVREEVGSIIISQLQYLGSKKIDDWRYRDNQHKIVSSLFIAHYKKGECKPSDDIEELMWVKMGEVNEVNIIESHKDFIERGLTYVMSLLTQRIYK